MTQGIEAKYQVQGREKKGKYMYRIEGNKGKPKEERKQKTKKV
jgi:hypothetical protein